MAKVEKQKPNYTYDALSLMSKLFYEQYGAEAIPIIREVWYKMGLASGARLKKHAHCDFKTTADVFVERDSKLGYPDMRYEVSEQSYRSIAPAGLECAVGLDNAGLPVCQAVMSLNQGQFEAVFGNKVDLEIVKSRAAGDDWCEIVLRPSKDFKAKK
jgi:predicted hydrocarbon binding protein